MKDEDFLKIFVGKFGIDGARKALSVACLDLDHVAYRGYAVPIKDLKVFLDAHDLVSSYGGIQGARRWMDVAIENGSISKIQIVNSELAEAIRLVEYVEGV